KQAADIVNPGRILGDGGVVHLEALFEGMKGDTDAYRLVIFGQHPLAEQSRHQSRDPLLTVNQNPLASRVGTVFQSHRRVAPSNEVTNRISLVERIQEIAHLGRIPDKRALDLRNGYLTRLYPGEQGFDGIRCDRI